MPHQTTTTMKTQTTTERHEAQIEANRILRELMLLTGAQAYNHKCLGTTIAQMGTPEYKPGGLAAIQNSIDALDKEINRLQTKLSNFINREA